MKILLLLFLIVSVFVMNLQSKEAVLDKYTKSIYEIEFQSIEGETIKLSNFKDKVVLVVNVASYCGLTSQYKKLQKLYDLYNNQGFEIIAFPCNQFGRQEPGNSKDIKTFCENNYKTTFLLSSKVDVNGDSQHDLYRYFKSIDDKSINKKISWNFTKFLIDKNGAVIDRFSPIKSPLSKQVISSIENALIN